MPMALMDKVIGAKMEKTRTAKYAETLIVIIQRHTERKFARMVKILKGDHAETLMRWRTPVKEVAALEIHLYLKREQNKLKPRKQQQRRILQRKEKSVRFKLPLQNKKLITTKRRQALRKQLISIIRRTRSLTIMLTR